MPLEFVSRRRWRGMKNPKQYYPIETPAPCVFLGYTNSDPCHDLLQCQRQLAFLQSRLGRITWRADIVYNFLISSEGVVYEARGWRSRPCLPARFTFPKRRRKPPDSFAARAYYIGFIGKYKYHPPSKRMMSALHELLCYAVKNDYVAPEFTMYTINIHVDRLRREYHRLKETHEPFIPSTDASSKTKLQ